MITGTISPVVALEQQGAGNHSTDTDAPAGSSVPSALDSRTLRVGALQQLEETDIPGNENRQFELETALEGTLSTYIDQTRTTDAPFSVDKRVAAQTQHRNPAVAAWLVESDAQLAATAISERTMPSPISIMTR